MELKDSSGTDSADSKSSDLSKIINQTQESGAFPTNLVSKQIISAALSISTSTVKHYRKSHWIEGVHFYRISPKLIRYNLKLIIDWAIHRSDPQAHTRAIETFLHQLESNQPKKRRRTK